MPMIDLTLPEGALTAEAKTTLIERLTTTVAKWEGVADNPQALQTIWAFFDERSPAAMGVGGVVVDKPHSRLRVTVAAGARGAAGGGGAQKPHYRLRVTVAAGALDDGAKSGLVAEATEALLAAEG